MRIVMAAIGSVFVGLLAVGVLGVASAETTPTSGSGSQVRTVSVEGVASESLPSTATGAAATGVYREAMAAAIADGKEKAQFLAEKSGATLGEVQNIGEGGGYISCPGEEEYTGGEPDFGSGAGGYVTPLYARGSAAPAPAHTVTPAKAKKHKRKHKHSAKAASVEPCSLSTSVSLVYALG